LTSKAAAADESSERAPKAKALSAASTLPLRRPRNLSYPLRVLYMACGLWRETTRITSTLIGGQREGADEWRRPARRHLVYGRR